MTEEFSKTKGKKILDLMKKIYNFKADERIKKLIEKFEEMVNKTDMMNLATNLKYAYSLLKGWKRMER